MRFISKPHMNRYVKILSVLSLLAAAMNFNLHSLPSFHEKIREGGGMQPPASIKGPTPQAEGDERAAASASGQAGSPNVHDGDDCVWARPDSVPASKYGTLDPPFVNLGFPKMGSTSIHSFFACAGYRAMHYRCKPDATCASCIDASVKMGLAPFAKCGKADAYSQIDDGSLGHFAQAEHLDEIVNGMPNATFILPFRSMKQWYRSMSNWPPENAAVGLPVMRDGLRMANITGFPGGRGRDEGEFTGWFCNHVHRVRRAVAGRPDRTLVEVDIEDPGAGSLLSRIFDVDEGCWGRRNVNARIHADQGGNQSNVRWFVMGKRCIRGRSGMRRKRHRELPPPPRPPGLPDWLFMDNNTEC